MVRAEIDSADARDRRFAVQRDSRAGQTRCALESLVRDDLVAMTKLINRLRAWLVSIVHDGTKPVESKRPMSGHLMIMKLRGARSLLEDGETFESAAQAVGLDVDELRALFAPPICQVWAAISFTGGRQRWRPTPDY